MSQSISIRRQEPDDYAQLKCLFEQPEVIRGTMQLPYPSAAMWRKRLEQRGETATPADLSLVAEIDDVIVGAVGLHPEQRIRRRHVASLGISVHDEYAGRGVGRTLMSEVLHYADNWLDLRRVELTVFADNFRAISLYESLGFEREGELRDYAYRDGAYVDALTMARLKQQ